MGRKLLITLDDDLDLWLSKQVNQNETVRNALTLYKDDITTDTVGGLRQSYKGLRTYMEHKFDTYDISFRKLDKLVEHLETRMM
jgi:hypothetical protein